MPIPAASPAPCPARRSLLLGLGAATLSQPLALPAALAAPSGRLDLGALEARHGGRLGVCAVFGSTRVGWRLAERFAYCSTFKLYLAAFVLDRVRRGLDRLDRAVAITQADMVPHGPVTQPAVGGTLTIERLCKATVEVSDNPAANILIREMGGLSAFQAWYRAIGDRVTRVDRWETDLNSAVPGDPRDTTTPDQYATNLDRVLRRGLLSAEHLSLLERWIVETPTGAGRIKAGLPAGHRLGHKTGTGARASHNDIGIIWTPSGASALLVVFFTGARTASDEQIDAVVADATRLALVAVGLSPG